MAVRQTPAGTFFYDFMVRGKRYRQAIPEARLKSQALLAEAQARDAVFNNKYNPQIGKTDFCKFVKEVYLPHSRKDKNSWMYDEYFANVIYGYFRGMKFADITKQVIRQFKLDRSTEMTQRGKTRAQSTVNREMAQLSAIFSYAKKEFDLCEINPCTDVSKFTVDNKRTRVLLRAEEEVLMPALPERINRIANLVLNTGMRRGEMLKLKVGNLNFEVKERFGGEVVSNGQLTLPKEITKGKRERVIPMNAVSRKLLLELVGDDFRAERKLFRGQGYHPSTVSDAFGSVCDELGMPDVTLHTLRHTFATRLIDLGVNGATVQGLLGHSDKQMATALGIPEITARYIHSEFEAMRRAVDLLVPQAEVVEINRKGGGLSTRVGNL